MSKDMDKDDQLAILQMELKDRDEMLDQYATTIAVLNLDLQESREACDQKDATILALGQNFQELQDQHAVQARRNQELEEELGILRTTLFRERRQNPYR